MKKIFFSRKQILRAIHAAAVAFYLAAMAAAHAQTATADGNGNVTINGSGSNYTYNGTNPALTAGGTLTVSGSSTISNTTVPIIISLSENATITNNGSLTVNENAAPGVTAGIDSSGGATASTINNTGTISAANTGSHSTAAIYYHTGTGDVTITNSGSLSGTYTGSPIPSSTSGGYGIWTTTTGAVTINSSGSGTISGAAPMGGNGIAIRAVDSLHAITITNVGTTLTASGYYFATGIDALSRGGAVSITNSGVISATTTSTTPINYGPSAYGIAATTANGFAISINNSGNITASAAYGTADDIFAGGSTAPVSVTNTANLTATSSGSGSYSAYGIDVTSTDGAITLTNSGHVTASSTYSVYGLEGYASGTGSATVSNSAPVSVTSTTTSTSSHVYGVAAFASSGGDATLTNTAAVTASGGYHTSSLSAYGANVIVTNSAQVQASSALAGGTVSGIYAGGSGNVTVNNTGNVSGISTGGIGYGIYASSGGPLVVNNTGSALGSAYGIYLVTPGTVNNHGLASGGTNSIYVPSGSTVNLIDASPVQGLVKGGADASSTSTLNFQIAIRGNVASAKASLDAAIAAYDQAYTAAAGVGNVDSSIVVLNGINYQWEDFFGISDNLVQGRLYATTPGFASLGSVLDTLPTNAVSTNLLNALNNVPDSGVAAALAELSPKDLQIFRNVAFDNNTFNVANVNNHLANRRDGLTGFDDSQMNVREGSMDPTLNAVRSHLLAFNPAPNSGLINDSTDSILGGVDMKDTRVNTMPTDRWSSFISGDVILADTSHNTNLDDADYTTGNVTGGLDYRLDQHFTVGALFAYAHTNANLDSRGSSATVDSYSPGIYASYVDGGWYGNALGAYTRNAYTEDRQIDITGLGGDNHGATSGNQGSVNLTGGYEFQKGSFKFGPVASVQYVHLSIDSISEQGPTALSIASQDQDSFRSLLGFEGRFSTKVATCYGPMIFTPHVSASWQHEYLDHSQGINADFTGTGGGSFTTQTDSPDRDSAFVDVGLDATVAKNVTLFVDYEAQAGQENFFAQSARGGVKIGF